jgi:nucleotide-binding universal stress UspA family protein
MEGTPLVEMLRITQYSEIDLVLVGKTAEHRDSGMLPEKLARKAPCSVLIIPEHSEPAIRKVLVALDFSEYSGDTLEVAVAFASAASVPEIICLHFYEDYRRYMRSPVIYKDLIRIIQENARRRYRKLVSTLDLKGCSPSLVFYTGATPWDAIAGAAENEHADLIVVGARGRTAPAAFVLGSVTERLISSTTVPLLAVKRKGTGLGLLDALLNQ